MRDVNSIYPEKLPMRAPAGLLRAIERNRLARQSRYHKAVRMARKK